MGREMGKGKEMGRGRAWGGEGNVEGKKDGEGR